MIPFEYTLNTNRAIVETTLCNMWRHTEAVYDWEPAMYDALVMVVARWHSWSMIIPQVLIRKSPLLIQYTLD